MTELRWRNVWGKINFSSDTHTLYLCRFTMRPHCVHPCACGEYDTSILRSCLLQISFRRNDTCTREFRNDVRGSKMKQDHAHWPGLWVSEHAEVWVPSFPHPPRSSTKEYSIQPIYLQTCSLTIWLPDFLNIRNETRTTNNTVKMQYPVRYRPATTANVNIWINWLNRCVCVKY